MTSTAASNLTTGWGQNPQPLSLLPTPTLTQSHTANMSPHPLTVQTTFHLPSTLGTPFEDATPPRNATDVCPVS